MKEYNLSHLSSVDIRSISSYLNPIMRINDKGKEVSLVENASPKTVANNWPQIDGKLSGLIVAQVTIKNTRETTHCFCYNENDLKEARNRYISGIIIWHHLPAENIKKVDDIINPSKEYVIRKPLNILKNLSDDGLEEYKIKKEDLKHAKQQERNFSYTEGWSGEKSFQTLECTVITLPKEDSIILTNPLISENANESNGLTNSTRDEENINKNEGIYDRTTSSNPKSSPTLFQKTAPPTLPTSSPLQPSSPDVLLPSSSANPSAWVKFLEWFISCLKCLFPCCSSNENEQASTDPLIKSGGFNQS